MYIALIVIHVIVAFAIIGIVLLQSGKGADIGSAFGGAGSQAVFGSMGTPTLLGKITSGVAIAFAITSFSLALIAGRPSSVVRDVPAPPAPAPQATPAPGAATTPAPAPSAPATPQAPATPPASPTR